MAIQSLVIILTVLIALLVIGVPISYAIGISSLAAILQIVPMDQPYGNSVFHSGRKSYESRRYCQASG